jgi:hypothetical protein
MEPGEVSSDGEFTVEHAPCLACASSAGALAGSLWRVDPGKLRDLRARQSER